MNWLYNIFGTILSFFNQITGSYALALVLYALVFKIVFLPFSIKTQKNQIAMAKLRPKLAKIEKKYAGRNDRATLQKKQQEIMELQQKEGYNPLSGCLPMLLQLPLILLIYAVIRSPISYIATNDGTSVERYNEIIEDGVTDEEWAVVLEGVKAALADLVAFRKQEGEALALKFQSKISNISQLLASVEPFEKERVEKIRARIEESLTKFAGVDYDRNRLEQEMIFYIEKLDVNEEKQRLANHLNYFVETMNEGQGQGKKLGFIAQEMGREINTLGSKSNHAEMQKIVVRMKDELEQIKEQVLNVM
jgi:YidC/Oxa1 family membrane protein insertase